MRMLLEQVSSTLDFIANNIVSIGIIVGATLFLYRKLLLPVHRKVNEILITANRLQVLAERVDKIVRKELRVNDGQSLKDEVFVIREGIKLIQSELLDMKDTSASHYMWSRALTKKLIAGEAISDGDLEKEQ